MRVVGGMSMQGWSHCAHTISSKYGPSGKHGQISPPSLQMSCAGFVADFCISEGHQSHNCEVEM